MKNTDNLTDDEYLRFCVHSKALAQSPNFKKGRQGFIAMLLLQTGLRVGEAVQLTAPDLIAGTDIVINLRVRAEIAKMKKERIIPLNKEIRELITIYISRHYTHGKDINNQWLFSSSHGTDHITTRQMERIIHKVGLAAIGRQIHPHLLRHTFATRLLKVSNIRVVQMLLGHSSIQSTQKYTHPSNEDLTKAINGLNIM